MPWIIGAAVVGSALLGNQASGAASDAQVEAGKESNATQLAMFNQNRADMAPWREGGVNALNKLTGQVDTLNRPFTNADFVQDPGYQFRLAEGEKAINRGAAARGQFNSGGTLKALQRYGQDYASGEFSNAYNRYNADRTNIFNRLAAISGIGQTATNQIGQQGASVASSIGQTTQGIGNARASGYVGGANAFSNAIGLGVNSYNQNQLLNRMYPQTGVTSNYSDPNSYYYGGAEG